MVQITNPNEPHSPTMPALPGESYDKPATGPTSSSSPSLTTTATTWTMTTLSSSSKHRPPLSSISSPQPLPSPSPPPSQSPSPSSSSSRPPLVASSAFTSYSSPPLAASSKGSGGERRNSGPGSGAPPTPPSSSRRPRQRLPLTNSPLPGSAAAAATAAAAGGGNGGSGGGGGGSGNPPPPPPPIPKLPPRSGASPRSSSSLVDMAGISVPPSSPRTVRSGISSSLPSSSSSSSPPQLPPPQGHRRVNSLPSSRAMAKRSHGTGADMASGGGGGGGAGAGGANSNNNNADALNDLGTLTTNLEEQTNKYGVGHAKVGLAHNLIGNYHFRRGDHDQAAKHYDEALRCFESSSPTSFPSAHVGLPLGSSSSSLSSLDDSINGNNNNNNNSNGNGGRSAELRHQLDVAVALSNIGAVLWSTGKLTEAIETLEKCIAIRRQVEACRPPTAKEAAELSNALYSLGLARSLRGDYDDALEALNQARDALTESNSSSSSAFVEFARIEDARGKVHLLRGDADSALECHLRAFHSKLSSGVLDGPSHPSILSTRSNVAAARKALGQWDEAESVLKDVLSAQKFALYRERDTNARRRLSADVELTVQALTEVQRERAKMGRRRARSRGGSMGSMSSEIMAAIIEEKGDGIVGNMSNGKGSGDNRRLAYKNANVDSDVSLNSG